MLSIWRYVVVGAVVAAAVLTPSTDPVTQMLLAMPLLGLYLGGACIYHSPCKRLQFGSQGVDLNLHFFLYKFSDQRQHKDGKQGYIQSLVNHM